MNVYIIHQYGEPEHFRSLVALKNKMPKSLHLFFADFRIKQDLYIGIKKMDAKRLRKGLTSLLNLTRSLIDKNGVIIWALAPGSKEISWIEKHYSKRKLIYSTSAAEWNWKSPELKSTAPDCRETWDRMLQKSHVVHVNHLSAAIMQTYHQCKSITVIPHSIEADIYNIAKRTPTRSDVLKVLYVGRIIPKKGLREYLWCAKQLTDKPIEFHCVGDGDEVLVKNIKHTPNIKYYGYIADKKRVSEIMQQMDVLVLPSYKFQAWEELFGMVIIEAMACGVVPIATDCIGPKCIIENQTNGILIPQKDKEALLREILRLYEDRELLDRMQKECIASASEYTTEKIAEIWSSVLARFGMVSS